MRLASADTVQVIYNIFEQSPEDLLFPACERHQVGIIVRVALDEGALTGKIRPDTTFAPGDFRSRYFRDDRKQQVYTRVQKIASDLDITLDQMAETALRFVLSHQAVSTVIPGMRSVGNVERNCQVGDGRGLSREQLEKLKPIVGSAIFTDKPGVPSLFWSAVLLCLLSAMSMSGEDLPHPTPVVSFAMPGEVDAPVDPDANEIAVFDDYSWRAFIALNWPAKPGIRGVPDESKKIGDSSGPAAKVVWETWKMDGELFQPEGLQSPHGSSLDGSLIAMTRHLQTPGRR